MNLQEHISLKGKTTMRIGGNARYYADLVTKEDAEEAVIFAEQNRVPLIVLGGGSNMIFADDTIEALVVRVTAQKVSIEENTVTVEAGKNLPQLINELAENGLDLSLLTGILGTVGGAIFGNAGQGPKGVWIDTYVESVTVYMEGAWKTLTKQECAFRYRESWFKDHAHKKPIIWEVHLALPYKPKSEIEEEIAQLLQQRIETQPHSKTAGSCFKAVGETPAWKLIDAAGMRGEKIGDLAISQKHTNFLINDGEATFEEAVDMVNKAMGKVQEPLQVEMRFVNEDGTLEF